VGRRRQARVPDPGARHRRPAIGGLLEEIQARLLAEATERRDANIVRDIASFDELAAFFGEDSAIRAGSSAVVAPDRRALDEVGRAAQGAQADLPQRPLDAEPADGACLFTGEPAVERIYVARAY
jgi:prolyl-tRNA synthetase